MASFIFEDRALTERERLAAAGHPAQVRTEWDNGSVIYRVVIGPFASPGAAERVADELLSSGTVQQARIVNLGKRN